MNAIVFLLFSLAATTLISDRRVTGLNRRSLYAPALILLGYVLSPEGLGFVLPSTLESLLPACRVGLFWTALLAGLNYRFEEWKTLSLAAMDCLKLLISIAITAAVVWTLTSWPVFSTETRILSGLFSSGGEILVLAAAGSGFVNWKSAEFGFLALKYFAMTMALASLLALFTKLLIPMKAAKTHASTVMFLAIVVLGAGLCLKLQLSEALVGFLVGPILVLIFRMPSTFTTHTRQTEVPVRMLLHFFLGLQMRFSIYAVAIGVVLAALRVLISVSILKSERRNLSFSRMAMPIALSLWLSSSNGLDNSIFIAALAAGLISTEILAIFSPASTDASEVQLG